MVKPYVNHIQKSGSVAVPPGTSVVGSPCARDQVPGQHPRAKWSYQWEKNMEKNPTDGDINGKILGTCLHRNIPHRWRGRWENCGVDQLNTKTD